MNRNWNRAQARPLLAIDFDDVLFDCDDLIKQILEFEFGYLGSYQSFVKSKPGMESAVFEFVYGKYHSRGQSLKGAKETLQVLTAWYTPIIISGRDEVVSPQTRSWLESKISEQVSDIYFSNEFLTAPNHVPLSKFSICKKLGVETIIEDSWKVAQEMAGGIHVLLLDKPWNKGEAAHVTRVRDWEHVLAVLAKNRE